MQTVETASHVVARLSSTPRWRKARARPRWKATECHLGEIWGDLGRHGEVWGGMGRYREVREVWVNMECHMKTRPKTWKQCAQPCFS